MTQSPPSRRLAAIMLTDIVGYSRMMEQDEVATLSALREHRTTLFQPAVSRYNGRVVKQIGDGTLVEFGSVVDALNCAVEIQTALCSAPDQSLSLRIGINLGDIMVEGDDIYGDGVNVAARLEALAEPGGICVSAIVAESAEGRTDIQLADAGEAVVKNISRPIRIWRWHPEKTSAQTKDTHDKGAEGRRNKASIAVLPFDNMSGDPEQEYFSDGICEDIITDLSKIGSLTVIARNSSFAYKGKSVDIRVVGRELGVSAVLEGSIRRAGNRVRITAQLIEAESGSHLWAERYDRDLDDIFAVQDEVTHKIVEALKLTLTPSEAARIAIAPTKNIRAHDLCLRGKEAFFANQNAQTFELAASCYDRAIELDPDYAEPYAHMAHLLVHDFQNKWSGREDSFARAKEFSARALEKNPSLPEAHYTAALVSFWERDFAAVTASIDTALSLNPNFALALSMRGAIKIYSGAPLDALHSFARATRLDPATEIQNLHFIGTAHLVAGEYEDAVEAFRKRIRLLPNSDLSRGFLISALGHLGRKEDAQEVASDLVAVSPGYSFDDHVARLPFTNPEDAARLRQGYAMADVEPVQPQS